MAFEKTKLNKNLIFRLLDTIENISNKLPNPFILFLLLALFVATISSIASFFDISVVHPVTEELVKVKSIFSVEGFREVLTSTVDSFILFPPLGVVLATLFGISVAEKSGFFEASLRHTIKMVPDKYIVFTIIFVSVNSSLIADAGLIVLPPLAGLTYKSLNKNPVAGVITSFAAICGGFSANLSITALDPLLSELTQNGANIIDTGYSVYPTANYYFMVISTFLVSIVCFYVNNKFVEPRLEVASNNKVENEEVFIINKKALFYSYSVFGLSLVLLFFLSFPENSFFRDNEGELTYLFKSIIPIIILLFFFSGLVYGIVDKKIKNSNDVVEMLNLGISGMASYIVIAFAAGQFLHYFDWSELDLAIAVNGAEFLKGIELSGLPLLIAFLIFSMILNILIASASAKWAIISPVFVPMFMLVGLSPEATQLIYRIGDSSTNMITPLLPYFPLLIVYVKKYKEDISMGELISSLFPFSFFLFVFWTLLLIIWFFVGIPIGPNANFLL